MGDSTWDLGDGLPGDFDAKITDCQFTYNPRYNNGQSCVCQFTLTSDDSEVGEEVVLYSMGKDWEPAEKGSRARWTGKSKATINRQSALGSVIKHAAEIAGDTLRGRGDPHEAKTWVGLSFHWDRETYVDQGGTERSRLVPTALVGSATVATNGKSHDTAEVALPAKIKTALMRIAASSDTHESFVEAALGVDGVTDEMRPAILSTQEGSIWATMSS